MDQALTKDRIVEVATRLFAGLGTGLLAPGQGMRGSEDREALKHFRAVLHTVIDRLPAPPPNPGQAWGAAWTRVPST